MLLTRDQVKDLSGYRKPSCQIRWLKKQGLPFFVGADGYPRVLETSLTEAPKSRRTEPDFTGLPPKR